MAGVYSDVGHFSSFNLPTPALDMGDLQPPVRFPQTGASSLDIGTVFF